jgi:outer membrane protein TolC
LLGPDAEPVDLANALRLAGVANPEILLARERVAEADALRMLAAAQILPNLNAGFNFDAHNGPLQQSNGNILKVNRDALYAGLGANAVGAGTVNIPGVVLAGNISEGIFAALISRQVVREREFTGLAVRNDVLLRVATAYLELLRAEGHRAIAVQVRDDAREVARVTAAFARTGQGRQADADRARTELEQRDADVLQAEGELLTASARLARLLDLDPSTRLLATDGWVVPVPIVPDPTPLPQLIALALTQRPELGERRAAVREALLALHGAKALPFSPTVILGYSTGTFGGGSNLVSEGILQPDGTVLRQGRFDSFGQRQDFDAVFYWTLRNLGVGNVALVRLARSNVRASELREVEVLDRVRAEVAVAYARAHARYAQIGTGEQAARAAARAFREDLTRTRNAVGLPIEVLDSLRLLGRSRYAYLDAIVDYNRAQFELYVALGQPPAKTLAKPVPAGLVPPPPPPAHVK